jgi:hypothetical protein
MGGTIRSGDYVRVSLREHRVLKFERQSPMLEVN